MFYVFIYINSRNNSILMDFQTFSMVFIYRSYQSLKFIFSLTNKILLLNDQIKLSILRMVSGYFIFKTSISGMVLGYFSLLDAMFQNFNFNPNLGILLFVKIVSFLLINNKVLRLKRSRKIPLE